ncbi:serine hydrolase [Candidatus Daviesbacteria bacterium]|nr:serine hydrolase [Candidatus Daviesbacteria bacterium]
MKSSTKFGMIVLIILGLLILIGFLSKPQVFNYEFKSSNLSSLIQKDLAGKNGTFAVYVENLASGEKYGVNERLSFRTASLYKLVLMAAILKEVELGHLTLDINVSASKSHLTDVLGGEDFGYAEMPEQIVYTIEEALERIGRISDNFAAIMLTEKLRSGKTDDSLAKMAQELGMDDTSFADEPVTTAQDMAIFFKKLYKGEVVSRAASDKISSLLDLSAIEDRIPAQLPTDLKIIHKTGELPHLRHDAGIVYLESYPYVIVLFSKDLKYEDDGVETLANISKDVYEYFSQKK